MAPTAKRNRRVVAGLFLLLLIGAGVVAVLSVRRNRARPVSVSDAQRRLPSTSAPPVRAGRPAAGVYEYRGHGTERLSLPPLSQQEGPTIPGTVTLLAGGCWRFRLDFSTNHWQDWTYCRHGDDIREAGGQSWQRWMIGPQAFTNLSSFSCDDATVVLPAVRAAGQAWPARCVGKNSGVKGEGVSAGPYRFVGDEDVKVGAATVRAAHFVRTRSMTGAQTGTERADVWFATSTGLPVRNRRTIEARTHTIVGVSTYTEAGEFELVSPQPR